MSAYISRRQFIGVTAAGAVVVGTAGGARGATAAPAPAPVAAGGGPGGAGRGVLAAHRIPQFRTRLPVPDRMRPTGSVRSGAGRVTTYDVAARQVVQQMLPAGLPATPVFAYGPAGGADRHFRFPSMTIEATAGSPVRVRWRNELLDAAGRYRRHLLPVDPTLHWANPGGGAAGRDTRPTFTVTPDRYEGPVPLVTHVHGATGVGDESDGYPLAWFLPPAVDVPAGYATTGSWYDVLRARAAARYGAAWPRGSAVFQYPDLDRACTNWFHDHTLGMTRLNVHAGLAGLFVVRGGVAGDDAVLDSATGRPARLPGSTRDTDDAGGSLEVPWVIADRTFRHDGTLFYPDSRTEFDQAPGPWIPDGDLSPIWNPEYFGNTMTVNGVTWPSWSVQRRRYRVRLVNACGSRAVWVSFTDVPGVRAHQVAGDGGFLAAPVEVTTTGLLLAPAERAELVLDFTGVIPGRYIVGNIGPDEPYQGGDPGVGFTPADPATTGRLLEVVVGAGRPHDPTTPADRLVLPAPLTYGAAAVVRRLAMVEMSSSEWDGPSMATLGTVDADPASGPAPVTSLMWGDPVTETPDVGVTEQWEVYNTTEDAHPVHVHQSKFEVVDRQPIVVEETEGADVVRTVQLARGSVPRPPRPGESGLKDTVLAYPGEVVRFRVRFDVAGQFVWHCHVLEHEDNEMMRPFRVGPPQPDAPAAPAG